MKTQPLIRNVFNFIIRHKHYGLIRHANTHLFICGGARQLSIWADFIILDKQRQMKQKQSLIQIVFDYIFGHKYYVNIINTRGVFRTECTSFIHPDKASAMRHKDDINSGRSYQVIETISFRSRQDYVLSDKIEVPKPNNNFAI